ncbi:MAG: 50S ribosomal protein L6 [Candidatus Micrarchaeota archaeon]
MDIPKGVTVSVDGLDISVKGPKGEVKKTFPKRTEVKVSGDKVEVLSKRSALKGTAEALLKNMVGGVTSGYNRKLKLLYAHFPITIEVKGSDIAVKNFLGEKMPRKTVLVGSTKVTAKGQNVEVSGPDKEAVGQTIANLKAAMRIRDKDGRIFQDGIFDIDE